MAGLSLAYVPSPQPVVAKMLHLARVCPRDFLIDLGSGDGRIVIAAAKRGARALGVELDPKLVEASREAAGAAGVEGRATFLHGDLFDADLTGATVITLYLEPQYNTKLLPKLLKLRPGTRIVSHDYRIYGRQYEDCLRMELAEKKAVTGTSTTRLFLFRAPLKRVPEHGEQFRVMPSPGDRHIESRA